MTTVEIIDHRPSAGAVDPAGITGLVVIERHRVLDDRGLLLPEPVLLDREVLSNLVTQIGDQYYGERAAGIASPPSQVTGMRLGTGSTAAAKTGAGAAIVTYLTASNVAVGTPTSTLNGTSRQIQWASTWAAGVATNAAITEAVLTNENPLTNVAGTAANTIARVVFSAQSKAAGDSLTITWSHLILGA